MRLTYAETVQAMALISTGLKKYTNSGSPVLPYEIAKQSRKLLCEIEGQAEELFVMREEWEKRKK